MTRSRHRRVLSIACENVEARRHFTVATVTGSNQAEDIRMTVTSSTILINVAGVTQSFPRGFGGFDSVSISASGGADRIYIDSNDGVPVTVNAGNGDDQIHLAQATNNLDEISSAVSITSSAGSDTLYLHDDNASFGDTYTVNNGKITRDFFGGVTFTGTSMIRLSSGGGADTFNVLNTGSANLIIDGQAGADVLKLNDLSSGTANVSFDSNQDFAKIQSTPGGNLTLLNSAGLVLTTNGSDVEGNVTLGTGYIIERNSQAADGRGYWRERLMNGKNSTMPSLTSSFATSSALSDAIGYAYAQNSALTTFGGVTLNDGDLVLRYTLSGDADLSGNVNFDDLVPLSQNYNSTGKLWSQGDFTLDGTVNFDDLVPLAQNYNQAVTVPTVVATQDDAKTTTQTKVTVTKKSGPAASIARDVVG